MAIAERTVPIRWWHSEADGVDQHQQVEGEAGAAPEGLLDLADVGVIHQQPQQCEQGGAAVIDPTVFEGHGPDEVVALEQVEPEVVAVPELLPRLDLFG